MPDTLLLNNETFLLSEIKSGKVKSDITFEKNTLGFIEEWLNNQQKFTFQTSGSTGTPKQIAVNRNQIRSSIKQTATFLNLKKGDDMLICLDTSKIAGIMMLARGLELEMNLTINTPTSNPLEKTQSHFDFAAMVPMQVQNTKSEELKQIKKLIIGGGTIDSHLEERLKALSTSIFHTYGMTETLSHVAMRQIAPIHSESFIFLPRVENKVNNQNCLSVKSVITENTWVHTNDIVNLTPEGFIWIGRKDNTINSGGYKVNLDILSKKIQELYPNFEFILTSSRDTQLGEKLVLISLKEENLNLESLLFYEQPKLFLKTNSFPRLASGKIDYQLVRNNFKDYKRWDKK